MQPGTDHLTPAQHLQLTAAEALFADPELELAPVEVARRIAGGEALLVDVREPYEHAAGHITGARLIEIERLGWNAPTLPTDLPLIFCCRLGVRAKLAAHAFRRIGFEAYNLTGGVSAWVAAGLPLDRADGSVADH